MVEPSKELQLVFDKSIRDARKLQHEYVTLEHLLFAMMCSDEFFQLLKGYGADVDYIKSNLEHFLKTSCDEIKTDLVGFIKDYINEIYLLEDKVIDTEMIFNIDDKFNKEFIREFRPLEITTIIDNLISNAEKANSTLVNLSFKKKKENVEFLFNDNGTGISKSGLKKVFELGYTTTNGSGIGLFQVNDLVENSLEGDIEIESEEKVGTTIKITLK